MGTLGTLARSPSMLTARLEASSSNSLSMTASSSFSSSVSSSFSSSLSFREVSVLLRGSLGRRTYDKKIVKIKFQKPRKIFHDRKKPEIIFIVK